MEKTLRVRDVFSITTGAMIGFGFFLLPGIASAASGQVVLLAYLLAVLVQRSAVVLLPPNHQRRLAGGGKRTARCAAAEPLPADESKGKGMHVGGASEIQTGCPSRLSRQGHWILLDGEHCRAGGRAPDPAQ